MFGQFLAPPFSWADPMLFLYSYLNQVKPTPSMKKDAIIRNHLQPPPRKMA